jgi:hypothetical protein
LPSRRLKAQRGAGGGLAAKIVTVLDGFHKQKMERGVDDMLSIQYEPIIWRALKAANSSVRANAAAVLFKAFPLQQPMLSRAENEELIQRQFDGFTELLQDECPLVRVTAVEGVFHAISNYWELIPSNVATGLLGRMVKDSACDATSSAVRAAVFRGLAYLTDNHLSIPLLKKLLPQMQTMIHDPAERVRRAYIDLLLTVKGIRDIKFYSIVPVEHLLARLETETTSNAKRIINLLAPSFFPSSKPDSEKIERLMHMATTNPKATRVFARFLHTVADEAEIGTFLVALLEHIEDSFCLPSDDAQTRDAPEDDEVDPMLDDFDSPAPKKKTSKSKKVGKSSKAKGAAAAASDNVSDDAKVALLDMAAIICSTMKPLLERPQNKAFCKHLSQTLTAMAETVMPFLPSESNAMGAVHHMRSCIPGSSKAVKELIAKLAAVPTNATIEDFGSIIDCACAWNHATDVLDLAQRGLAAGLEGQANRKRGKQTSSKGKSPAVEQFPTAVQSLAFIDRVICVLARSGKSLPATHTIRVVATLTNFRDIIGRRLGPDQLAGEENISDQFLTSAMQLYFKLLCCMGSAEVRKEAVSKAYTEVMAWATSTIVPKLNQSAEAEEPEGGKRKRSSAKSAAAAASKLSASTIIELTLSAVTEIFKLGLFTADVSQDTLAFAEAVVGSTSLGHTFAVAVGSFLKELSSTCAGPAMEHDLDVSIQGLWRNWLTGIGRQNDPVLLFSIRPSLMALCRQWQRRDMLAWSTTELAMMSTELQACPVTIRFFLGLVRPSESMMQHFISSLPIDATSAEDSREILEIFDKELSEGGASDNRTISYKAMIASVVERLSEYTTTTTTVPAPMEEDATALSVEPPAPVQGIEAEVEVETEVEVGVYAEPEVEAEVAAPTVVAEAVFCARSDACGKKPKHRGGCNKVRAPVVMEPEVEEVEMTEEVEMVEEGVEEAAAVVPEPEVVAEEPAVEVEVVAPVVVEEEEEEQPSEEVEVDVADAMEATVAPSPVAAAPVAAPIAAPIAAPVAAPAVVVAAPVVKAPKKQSKKEIRARKMAISKISVALTEHKMKLEELVKNTEFIAAGALKLEISKLERERATLRALNVEQDVDPMLDLF